mmetsp:Transcript_4730/g.17173  ORF Transcript_4730/g.17173 Transcript_4730/m.17173 type:complete len:242 (-) Transcript_4730:416-1141(-)
MRYVRVHVLAPHLQLLHCHLHEADEGEGDGAELRLDKIPCMPASHYLPHTLHVLPRKSLDGDPVSVHVIGRIDFDVVGAVRVHRMHFVDLHEAREPLPDCCDHGGQVGGEEVRIDFDDDREDLDDLYSHAQLSRIVVPERRRKNLSEALQPCWDSLLEQLQRGSLGVRGVSKQRDELDALEHNSASPRSDHLVVQLDCREDAEELREQMGDDVRHLSVSDLFRDQHQTSHRSMHKVRLSCL